MRKAFAVGLMLAVPVVLSGCAMDAKTTPLSVATGPLAVTPVALTPPAPVAPVRLSKPQWKVGDRWTYSDGYGMQVSEVNGDLARFQRTDDSGQWFVNRGLFRERTKSRKAQRDVVFRSDNPDRLYGMPLGEPVVFIREYTNNGELVRHSTSWVAEGRETISVPAGTFDTIVLVMRTRSLTGNWTGYERWWYSPAARNYVRLEYKYGEAPESARVLTALDLK